MKNRSLLQRALVMCTILLIMAMTCTIAYADVIWEPDDDFYKKNAEFCEYEGRNYTVNSREGSVKVQKSPQSTKLIDTVENGVTLYVSFTYTDRGGKAWGVVELDDDRTGWLLMKNLAVVYDSISFKKDHADEFKKYNDEFTSYDTQEDIIFWSFPGSGEISARVSGIRKGDMSISYTYTDVDGRLWGYVGYYQASKGWICISDPMNEAIPANESLVAPVSAPSEITTAAVRSEYTGKAGFPAVIYIVSLVAVVTAVTAILIRVLWKKT
jgi:hypothetical protein